MDTERYAEGNGALLPSSAAGEADPDRYPSGRHILLFIITILSTIMIGSQFQGYDVITAIYLAFNPGPPDVAYLPQLSVWDAFVSGIPYSFAVLFILTCHEMGHFIAARYHGMKVSWPYYIPLPLPGAFHFGTMGAFIRIKSLMNNRNALMDVAVAGPLAGFVASILMLFIGYGNLGGLESVVKHVDEIHPWSDASFSGLLPSIEIVMGKSLLFYYFNDVLGQSLVPMSEIYHFPYIFAGWVGFFVTAMNLFLIGQLDGGHVIYGLAGPRAGVISYANYIALLLLSLVLYWLYSWNGLVWGIWMLLLLVIGLGHPPTRDDSVPLTPLRRNLGLLCILIFLLCFIPLPIYIN